MAIRRSTQIFLAGAMILSATFAQSAKADEGGASIYLLGSGGPGAAVLPPLRGIFLDNTIYVYDGRIGGQKDFLINGNVVADVHATLPADFATLLWVPTTNFAGGTLAVAVAMPFAAPMIDASAVITGPGGRTLAVSRHDSTLTTGDPIVSVELGWKTGKLHIAASTFVNIPIGNYREGQLANLSFHRWAGDASLAASWVDEKSGWDISAKAGITFNGKNDFTDYNSGNDLHLEASVEKKLNKQFSAGLQGYQFFQISDDGGSGAKLGGFRGKVTGLGATVAYSTVLGRAPTTFRLRAFQEFWEKNRMQGTGVMLSITLPLSMKIPGK